jgi:hypothetical protein
MRVHPSARHGSECIIQVHNMPPRQLEHEAGAAVKGCQRGGLLLPSTCAISTSTCKH